VATATVAPSTVAFQMLPPDDELRFDDLNAELGLEQPSSPRALAGWTGEPGGVKAAILRWLEEQA
jgi:hypothetical protein